MYYYKYKPNPRAIAQAWSNKPHASKNGYRSRSTCVGLLLERVQDNSERDIAKKMLQDADLSQEDKDFLDSIYGSLQSLEMSLTDYLDDYRAAEIISKEEFLVVANYFLIARQNGPDSEMAINLLTERKISSEGFSEAANGISIPEDMRKVLTRVYGKIY